jgi:hypothetical protein
MIAGTRYYNNRDLHVSEEDTLRTAAFIEADIKHREDPTSVIKLLKVPNIRYPNSEKPELYNLAVDPSENENVAEENPEIVFKLLNSLENWFDSVENDRKKIDDPLHAY